MKYLADGRAVEVIRALNDGFLVQYYYTNGDCSDEPLYLDRTTILFVDKVFDVPPTPVYHNTIISLNEEIDKLTKSKAAMKRECSEIEMLLSEARKKRAGHDQLKLLDDFLAGRITHLVDVYYYEPRILDLSAALDTGDAAYPLKLVTLFGNSNGDFQWKISRYADGSGGYRKIYPVTSYEEALAVAKGIIASYLEDTKTKPSVKYVEFADKWGVEVPEDYRAAINSKQRAELLLTKENLQDQLAQLEEKLKKLGE